MDTFESLCDLCHKVHVYMSFCIAVAQVYVAMPGEIEKLARNPLSFYGSRKSTNGYHTRQTLGTRHNGLKSRLNTTVSTKHSMHSRRNGVQLRCGRPTATADLSNKIPVRKNENGAKVAMRHCRYINMQMRRIPDHQFGSSHSNIVNGSSLSIKTSSDTACRQSLSPVKNLSVEKVWAKSMESRSASPGKRLSPGKVWPKGRESRVLISAELKTKADREMSSGIRNVCTSIGFERDDCSKTDSGPKRQQKKSEVMDAKGTRLEKSSDKGLKLRNGRSLPDCKAVMRAKSEKYAISSPERRRSVVIKCEVKKKKSRLLYRSRSLSPAKSLALSRPRRNVFAKKSVCCIVCLSELRIRFRICHCKFSTCNCSAENIVLSHSRNELGGFCWSGKDGDSICRCVFCGS